ncbi:MAG: sigma-54 dependent transcriptional regulator [Pseudomonadota bacterium]
MDSKRALIVDDEPDIRELLEITLGRMNIDTEAAPDLRTARSLLDSRSYDLCLTDLQLPDGNGLDLVQEIALDRPALPVAVITAFGSMDAAIRALKCGAFDFVEKPVDLDRLRQLVDTALKLEPANQSDGTGTRLIGSSPAMDRLREQITKLARSQAPIYISGESGSGKEVAARLIHEQGPRADAPFVPVNCGAIPSELMESEFFGHTKGSFTGANADKEGLFKAAQGGTLFLDEVADLPLSMQVKLLRAIQEKAIRSVGAHSEAPIDVRILSATHKDLAAEVQAGRFRQDLYYRLNVIELGIPSLRERRDDIEEHAARILTRLADDYAGGEAQLSTRAVEALRVYDFPGNVRELENILERAYTLCNDNLIELADLQLSTDGSAVASVAGTQPPISNVSNIGNVHAVVDASADLDGAGAPATAQTTDLAWLPPLPADQSLEEFLETIERAMINRALESTRWNKTAAAKELGITFRALRYRLKKLELE